MLFRRYQQNVFLARKKNFFCFWFAASGVQGSATAVDHGDRGNEISRLERPVQRARRFPFFSNCFSVRRGLTIYRRFAGRSSLYVRDVSRFWKGEIKSRPPDAS